MSLGRGASSSRLGAVDSSSTTDSRRLARDEGVLGLSKLVSTLMVMSLWSGLEGERARDDVAVGPLALRVASESNLAKREAMGSRGTMDFGGCSLRGGGTRASSLSNSGRCLDLAAFWPSLSSSLRAAASRSCSDKGDLAGDSAGDVERAGRLG